MEFVKRIVAGIAVTTDAIDALRAAQLPDSPGGVAITRAEAQSIGEALILKLADAAGVAVVWNENA
jgi:hypothetical protein